MKKLCKMLIVAFVVFLFFVTASADSVEDYTLSKLNDKVDRYHITSDVQLEKGIKGGEGAQIVYSMAASPHDSQKMILGNNTTGIYRSDDGGAYWYPSSEGLFNQCVDTVVYDPDTEDVVYAMIATGSNPAFRIASGAKIGVYKSIDGGSTWTFKLPLCNERNLGNLIAFGKKTQDGKRPIFAASSSASEYQGYASGTTGLWRSLDMGETWECLGLTDRSIMSLYTLDGTDTIFVASDKGIDVSYNGGQTFSPANGDLPFACASTITVNPNDSNHWFAGIIGIDVDGSRVAMLYETKNSGTNWTKANDSDFKNSDDTVFITSLNFIKVSGQENPRLLMAVYKYHQPNRYSDDMGKTFSKCVFKTKETYGLYDTFSGYFSLPFCISPYNDMTVFTSFITPHKSTDGGKTFEFTGSGYSGFALYDMHFADNGAIEYISITDVGFARMDTTKDSIFSPSLGISKITLPDYVTEKSSTAMAVDPNNSNHGFVAMGGYMYAAPTTLLETNDGFKTLNPIDSFDELNRVNQKTVYSVWYHNQNPNIVYTDYYVSEDNGLTWRESERRIRGISNINSDTVYAFDDYKIYVSYDRGKTWIDTLMSVDDGGKYQAFCVDMFYEDVIWTADRDWIYRIDIKNNRIDKKDGGSIKFEGLQGYRLELMGILQNPALKGHMVLSGRDLKHGGSFVYETFDYGENWSLIDEIPLHANVIPIEFHPTENILFLSGMLGTIVYKWDVDSWHTMPEIKLKEYNELTGTYTFNANVTNNYYNSPVTLAITDDANDTRLFFAMTDGNGNFIIEADGFVPNTGNYMVKVSLIDQEGYFTDTFTTGERIVPTEEINAIYSPYFKNFVVYGISSFCETVTFVLKEKKIATSEITNDNFIDCVKYIGEITPDEEGDFVYKFRFEIPKGKSTSDYNINIMTDKISYKDVPIQVVTDRDYNFSVTTVGADNVSTDISFAKNSPFTAKVKWKYFMEDKLPTELFAALYDSDGNLLNVFANKKDQNYDAQHHSVSGTMSENTSQLKVMLWSELYPLGISKTYTASGEVID